MRVPEERDKRVLRTVYLKGVRVEDLSEGSELRECLEFREYNAGQITNFAAYDGGVVIEYTLERFVQSAKSINIKGCVAAETSQVTVEEARLAEQRNLLAQVRVRSVACQAGCQWSKSEHEVAETHVRGHGGVGRAGARCREMAS